ncbi:major facilitator superfamily domain-containing protein [Xylaria bambusicola]|uniref:major facilitator superfamily domain-containing protein n=1 Tax=Xylaria bambusicola TaxID=326684 RepID=UPI0020082A12|nr:major facilitator superfamily domain-containing protein [Xylaria bambusicola]KAI0505913.1 major facilitator superfamily domain-containing protein [Xylaria bambusicola]
MSNTGKEILTRESTEANKDSLAPDFESSIDEAKLLRKIDFHVLPILWVVYVAAFLDRVNISNALTLGLPEELGLNPRRVSIMLAIFFVPYTICEIPANILMKRLNPHNWLSGCILAFGLVTIGQGFVQSYEGILVARFFLGVFEAGVFPGCFYLISFWYKRDEAQKRFTIYFSSVIVSNAFGGLLAGAIAKLEGARGLASWRWIFILEGTATIVIGFIAFFCITDFPMEARWLAPDERAFILAKTESNESHRVPITLKDVLHFLSKPINWCGGMMYFTIAIPTFTLAFFIPTIVQTLGYGPVQTQLYSIPPHAAGLASSIILAYVSDRYRIRSLPIFVGLALMITGIALLASFQDLSNFSAEYAAICLTTIGAAGCGGIIICWWVMNLRGHVERSIGSAWLITLGSIGAMISTFSFKRDVRSYRTGYTIGLAAAVLCAVMCALYGLLVWRKRKAEARSEGIDGIKRDQLFL